MNVAAQSQYRPNLSFRGCHIVSKPEDASLRIELDKAVSENETNKIAIHECDDGKLVLLDKMDAICYDKCPKADKEKFVISQYINYYHFPIKPLASSTITHIKRQQNLNNLNSNARYRY